jgi:hypothetical protein
VPDVLAYFDESGLGGSPGTWDGWAAFGAWADDLPVADYPQVLHLWENGWEDDLAPLETQLKRALSESPPDLPAAREVAEELLDIIASRAEADAAVAITA